MPLFTNLVEKNVVGFQECFMVGCCPYCGLGFAPMWACKLASYKHFYHCWHATIHFNSCSKCIKARCEKEMHEMWWSFAGIGKLGTFQISDIGFKASSSKPKFPPKVKFSPKGKVFSINISILVVCAIVSTSNMCEILGDICVFPNHPF
jgi:hypothetical protein